MSEQSQSKQDAKKKELKPRVNPYVGPRPFQPGEELFGRDREKRDLFDQVLAERIVLLHSPSGAGKSSLVNAGLIPMLRKEGLVILPVVRVGEEPPERFSERKDFNRFVFSMMLSLDGELAQAEAGEGKSLSPEELAAQEAQRKARQDELAGLTLKEYLVQRRSALETDLNVIVFDQCEEIITAAPTDLHSKQAFFRQIGDVLSDRSLWALFVIRDDFLGALEPYALNIPTQLTNTFRLDLLGSEAAKQAIQKPVAQQGIEFLDPAAQKLVDDLRLVPSPSTGGEIVTGLGLYVEPVQLQVVCLRLYDQLKLASRPEKTQIDEQDIQKVGDVGTALANYYAERVASVADSRQVERQVRDWFDEKLITKSGLRSQVMMEVDASGGLENSIIRQLERSHLVRAEKRRGVTWFELAHDRLVRPVQRDNDRWRRENLSAWQLRAIEWQKNSRPDEQLLRGVNLDQALAWAGEHQLELSEVDQNYLQASSKWRETHLSPLQRKAAEWEAQGHQPELLLTGAELQQASEWAMTNTDEITSRELEYLDASRAAAQEEERKQREQTMQLEFERQRADEQERNARRLQRRAVALGAATVAAV
ncbi:MAG: nSTAND1 domain-containing NTPase, partial [Anaerolineales bacterium]